MPAYVTHALFSQQALSDGGFALRDCCLRHANLYRFGAQGPDVFYYLNSAYPLKGYTALADKLHELEATAPLEALHSIPERERERAMMCAYLCGWASHLMLDGLAHPIVEERARGLAAELGVSEDCAHAMLECRFEARHYNERTGKQARGHLFEADLPSCEAERAATARAWLLLFSQAGVGASRTDALAREQRALPKTLELLFSNEKAAHIRLCDAARRLSRRDFALRWRFKRTYEGENAPMTENDYGSLCAAYDEAMRRYLRLMSG